MCCICVSFDTSDEMDNSVCGKELITGSVTVRGWNGVESIPFKIGSMLVVRSNLSVYPFN